ncbi:MAG: helix-turn-helix transcriptional regulator [Bauldia sp.]|jgi:DNA-binding XRE family transcriptional regulator
MGKPVRTVTPSGEEIVIVPAADYDRLVEDFEDRIDNAAADAILAKGVEWLSDAEVDEYLAAPTPLAFWRKRRKLTQGALAQKVGITQSYVAQIESGRRKGEVDLYRRLAEALQVRMEDLVMAD